MLRDLQWIMSQIDVGANLADEFLQTGEGADFSNTFCEQLRQAGYVRRLFDLRYPLEGTMSPRVIDFKYHVEQEFKSGGDELQKDILNLIEGLSIETQCFMQGMVAGLERALTPPTPKLKQGQCYKNWIRFEGPFCPWCGAKKEKK